MISQGSSQIITCIRGVPATHRSAASSSTFLHSKYLRPAIQGPLPAHQQRGRPAIYSVPRSSAQSSPQVPVEANMSSTQRHAALHDFCMCIPYGILVAIGGVIAALAGSGTPALYIAAAGVAEVVLSNLSLKTWRQGRSSTLYTLVAAGIAGAVGWVAWQAWNTGVKKIASGSLLGLSVAATTFLLYNILAGGNPPRQVKTVEGGAAAAAAAADKEE